MRRSDRLSITAGRRFGLYVAACLALLGAATAIGLAIVPDDLGHELGPIQLSQGAVLVLAAAGLVHRVRADGPGHRLAPVWVTASCLASWLAWREIELDKHLFGLHMFSWRYLVRDVPGIHKVVFATISAVCLLAFARYLRRHWQQLVSGLRQSWPPLPVALGAAGALILAVSQLWDKAPVIESLLAITAFRSDSASLESVHEEVLELGGQLLLLCAVVELNILARRAHPALLHDATPDRRDR